MAPEDRPWGFGGTWDGAQWTEQTRPAGAQHLAPPSSYGQPTAVPPTQVAQWGEAGFQPAAGSVKPKKHRFLKFFVLFCFAFLLLGIVVAAIDGSSGTPARTVSPTAVASAQSVPAPAAPVTDCVLLFAGPAIVRASDADTGCTGYGLTAGVRLFPSSRDCTDGRTYLSLHDNGMKRIYFGFVGEAWGSIRANAQNLALLDASRRECSGS